MDVSKVSRVVVITEKGRTEELGVKDVQLLLQDDGQTLKLFFERDEERAEQTKKAMDEGMEAFFQALDETINKADKKGR